MKTLAAVLINTGKPLEILEIEIPALKPGQVLVEIYYSGVCHTQVSECRGYRGEDRFLPHCMGHEGSGIVRAIGQDVKKVAVGDRAILSWIKGSGADVPGTVYNWNDQKVNSGAITTFSHYSVISENRVTKLPEQISLRDAALIGCAIPTGMGSVFNTAKPNPGQSLVVFGTGGVGLFAVAAAAIAGCVPVIAVDIQEHKLEIARRLGATHCINASQVDVLAELKNICPNGVDYAIEVTGVPKIMSQAIEAVRSQGGTTVIIGNAHHGDMLTIDPRQFNMGKRILGTWGGDNWPDVDYVKYCKLMQYGKLDVEPFVAQTYSLENINKAIDDLEAGIVIRPLIDMKMEIPK